MFKEEYRCLWDQWLEDPEMIKMTSVAHMRAHPALVIVDWVKRGVESSRYNNYSAVIQTCGISLSSDSSEDGRLGRHDSSDDENGENVVDVIEKEESKFQGLG